MNLLRDMALRFQNYASQGGMFTVGYMPETGFKNLGATSHMPGTSLWGWGGQPFIRTDSPAFGRPGPLHPLSKAEAAEMAKFQAKSHGGNLKGATTAQAEAHYRNAFRASGGKAALSALGPAVSGYFLYQGYQGNLSEKSGISGAAEAGIWDIATSSAIAAHAYKRTFEAGKTITRSRGMFSFLTTAIGAGTGASIGQSALGAPGAFFGGYVGGLLGRHPIVAAATAATIGGGYLVGKGAFSLLKTGYRQRQEAKTIHTAGDTAAFFTQNAMTMRSRAVQQMRNSHLNARSALGGEANFMHMPRNFFSSYR